MCLRGFVSEANRGRARIKEDQPAAENTVLQVAFSLLCIYTRCSALPDPATDWSSSNLATLLILLLLLFWRKTTEKHACANTCAQTEKTALTRMPSDRQTKKRTPRTKQTKSPHGFRQAFSSQRYFLFHDIFLCKERARGSEIFSAPNQWPGAR